jgi:hypothetical protein
MSFLLVGRSLVMAAGQQFEDGILASLRQGLVQGAIDVTGGG